MIKKAELIERLKNGETLTCLYGWGNQRDSYWIGTERVHFLAAHGLKTRGEIRQLKHSHSSSEYVWNKP